MKDLKFIVPYLITPLILLTVLPLLLYFNTTIFSTGAAVFSKEDVYLNKLYPEEIEHGVWSEDTIVKIEGNYYCVGAYHKAFWPYLYDLFRHCFWLVLVGNIITFFIVKRISSKKAKTGKGNE